MPPRKGEGKGAGGKGANDDEEPAEDATATIAGLSTAIVHLANIAGRAEDDRAAVQEALTAAKESFEGFQTFIQGSSMIKTDPIVGEITPGTKPVLEPMPDVKPLPDGFRYKPDLANPTGQALHFEQCIDRIRDHSEKQVRGIIKTLRKEYVLIQYQYRPGWQPANIAQKFAGNPDNKDALNKWKDKWSKPVLRIDSDMKAEIMIGSLTGMVESQLHDIFAVTKTGNPYAINISPHDELVKPEVLQDHREHTRFVPGFEGWDEEQDGDPIYPPILDENHANYDADPLKVKRQKTLRDMIVACGYYRQMAQAVRMIETGVYDNLLLLFEDHQDILDTLKTFKNAKHTPPGTLTGANKQAFSALPKCGSAALHHLCTSLNPPNPFLDTELWLQFFDLAPTGNAAEMINERANLEARIKNHFTSIDGIVDTARMAMSKKSAQLIKDTTTNNPGLREMLNVKIAAREPVVSNFDTLKALVIGMSQKGPLGSSDKIRRVDDGTPRYGGPLQFDNSPQMRQPSSTWASDTSPSTWSQSPSQFGNDGVFAAIVDDGPCSFLQINMLHDSDAYSHKGEWILAATTAASRTPVLADAKDRIAVCTNCDTGGGPFRRPRNGQPHNPPFCDKPCRLCDHPPDSHAEHCIRYKGWLRARHPERLPPKPPPKPSPKQSMRASTSTSATHRPFRRSVTEINRRLTADEGAALATVVGSQSQLLVMAADPDQDRRALAEDLAAHNAAHHEELFHIIEHTDPTHRAQSDQMEFASGTGTQSSAQNNARARINQSTNQHISVWRAAADMALDEMDPAARAQVVPQLPAY